MTWILALIIFIVATYLLANIPFMKERLRLYYDQYLYQYAKYYANAFVDQNDEIIARKGMLFDTMEDVINRTGGPILEIGCGPGFNLSFYPSNTKMCTLDLNDHFKPYLMSNMKSSKAKLDRYAVGNAEDMSDVFADNTFSCVVCTFLLCSVDQEKTLREVMRVLKPGGRFYFLEHILEKRYTFTWLFQIAYTRIWKLFTCNCQADRDTDKILEKFGFENFELAIWYRPLSWRLFFTRRSCIGFGDKA